MKTPDPNTRRLEAAMATVRNSKATRSNIGLDPEHPGRFMVMGKLQGALFYVRNQPDDLTAMENYAAAVKPKPVCDVCGLRLVLAKTKPRPRKGECVRRLRRLPGLAVKVWTDCEVDT